MNVLILTPDAVGSTLLQRLITIYMQFHDYDRPVINLHELTNGLEKYFSPDFNREIVSKRRVQNWGYHQSLQDIVELLASVDHFKTSRLAQYHIRARQDPMEQQIPFYRYLDENFFVISCRRNNVFEHALSQCINRVTKKLNVYDSREKIQTFLDLYRDRMEIDQQALTATLDAYKNYLAWSENHFNIASYFYYDRHLDNIERYILSLPIFPGNHARVGWQDKFGIGFDDWNRCHCAPGDIGRLALQQPQEQLRLSYQDLLGPDLARIDLVHQYQQKALPDWPSVHTPEDFAALPENIRTEFLRRIDSQTSVASVDQAVLARLPEHRQFVDRHRPGYERAQGMIKRMVELDIMISAPPIKKQTMAEKQYLIKNFDQCMDTYNQWADQNPSIAAPITPDSLGAHIAQESVYWQDPVTHAISAGSVVPPSLT